VPCEFSSSHPGNVRGTFILDRRSTSAFIKDHVPNIYAQPYGEVRHQAATANGIRSHNTTGRRATGRADPRPTTMP
jgi:hypothetical protein